MNLAKKIIKFVLANLERDKIFGMKATLENALKIAEGLDSDWTAESVLTVLFQEVSE